MDDMNNTLVVDIGNTMAKAALFKGMELLGNVRLKNLEELRAFTQDQSISGVMVARVGNALEDAEKFLQQNFTTTRLGHGIRLPFTNGYQTRETLGADRVAAVAGAQHFFPEKNCLVIDMGSCITFDFLDANGMYHGGAISPGMMMRFRAMHEYTGKLPEVHPAELPDWIGNSTEGSLQSGVFYGITDEINGAIDRYEQKFGSVQVVLCGGDSYLFGKHIKNNIFAAPELVLYGLNKILLFHVQG